MKIQDIIFILVAVGLILYSWKKPKWLISAGILCLALSIPLFSFWIFFTAQRLVYYSAGLIFIGVVIMLFQMRREE